MGAASHTTVRATKEREAAAVEARLAARLRARRRLRGLTLQQVADACGVNFRMIHKYETGAARVSALMLWRLAAALETPMAEFFAPAAETPSAMAEERLAG